MCFHPMYIAIRLVGPTFYFLVYCVFPSLSCGSLSLSLLGGIIDAIMVAGLVVSVPFYPLPTSSFSLGYDCVLY